MRPFFEWCDKLPVSEAIRGSKIIFPIIETVHLLGLTVLLGAVLILGLRLLGAGLRKQPLAVVAAILSPLINWSILVMLVTGSLLFSSEAIKCYENPPFFFKMSMLGVSILFQLLVVGPAVRKGPALGRGRAILTGLLSLFCWFSVAAGGRAIGFY